jgi:hypothetical protein
MLHVPMICLLFYVMILLCILVIISSHFLLLSCNSVTDQAILLIANRINKFMDDRTKYFSHHKMSLVHNHTPFNTSTKKMHSYKTRRSVLSDICDIDLIYLNIFIDSKGVVHFSIS